MNASHVRNNATESMGIRKFKNGSTDLRSQTVNLQFHTLLYV